MHVQVLVFLGGVPVVFATLAEGYSAHDELKNKIEQQIVNQIGRLAKPQHILFVEAMPKTVSGKIMRRLLKEVQMKGDISGDVTGLEDPEAIQHIKDVIASNLDPQA